jgi:hypothetical protein
MPPWPAVAGKGAVNVKFSLIERTFAIAVALGFGFALGISSIGVVSAARNLASKSCNSGSACTTYTNKGGGPGIQGNNTNSGGANAFGVLGTSSGTDGVHGISTHAGSSGVAGIMTGSSSSNGNGVYGQSSDSSGKYAALYAAGYNSGTYLFQGFNFSTGNNCKIDPNANLSCTGDIKSSLTENQGVAVSGVNSGNGNGMFAESADTTGNFEAFTAYGTNTATYLFGAVNEANQKNCVIDPMANLTCSGAISGNAVHIRQQTTSHRRVLAYTSESATATIEDVGTARMDDGVADVRIPPDFAATIEPRSMYYVFLTPLADTRGLYVSFKGAAGFQVRETEHGRSSIAFDYRIVAHPLAASDERLPAAPTLHRPRLPAVRP